MNSGATEQQSPLADFPMLREKIDHWKTTAREMDWTPWLIVGLGALLRVLFLAIKPPHFDEGINGWFVDSHIVKMGYYRYDPTNYHGPLHFYVLFLFKCLFGRNLWALRMPVVIVSTISIWLALKFEPFVSRKAARLAALAMAVSPGFVFYGRYSIHEAWLLMFSMMSVLGLLGLWRAGSLRYLWGTAMGVAGMILTKETYIIHMACALIAIPVLKLFDRFFVTAISPGRKQSERRSSGGAADESDTRWVEQQWDLVDLVFVIFVSVALIVFFYSGTFFHWNGVKDIFMAYRPWFETGSDGHGHDKPWYYWIALIGRYEAPALIGLLLCGLTACFKNFAVRYLAIYGGGTLVAYSIVNYKTPWCIISIVWPFLFLFGASLLLLPVRFSSNKLRLIGLGLAGALLAALIYWRTKHFGYAWPFALIGGAVALLFALRDARWIYSILAAALLYSLGYSVALNYFRYTNDTEPYVYVQTFNDIWKLTRPLLTLAQRNPVYYQMVGHLVRQSSYPLPWMLGDFPRVGYYERDNLPAKMDADFLLVEKDKIDKVEPQLHESYYTEPLRIRAYQDTSKLFLNAKRFAEFFPGRQPDFVGSAPKD